MDDDRTTMEERKLLARRRREERKALLDAALGAEPQPVWCPVANVVAERPYGPHGAEIRRGTKHFAPGAKVYCLPFDSAFWGGRITVIGHHHRSHRYIKMIVAAEVLTNWRVELVYSPHVIREIVWSAYESAGRDPEVTVQYVLERGWTWDGSSESKARAEQYVKYVLDNFQPVRTMTARIAANDPQALPWAAEALERGALVAIPTDTVYGIAARLDRQWALRRLYEAKGRPEEKAIPVLVSDADLLDHLARDLPPATEEFAARFWPGPLTIVLPRGPAIPDLVTGGGDTVGLRMPAHPVALGLLEACGGALAVTSANRSGEPSLSDPAAVEAALGGELELILDSGATPGGRPSTVIALSAAGPAVLREGPIDAATLRAVWEELTGP